jgi:hypothetical protein
LLTKGPLNPHRFRRHAFRPGKRQIQCAFAPVPREGVGAASGETEG